MALSRVARRISVRVGPRRGILGNILREWNTTGHVRSFCQGKERKNDGVKDSTRAPNFGQKVDQIKDYGFRRLGLPSYLWTKMDGMNISSPTLIQSSAIPKIIVQRHNPNHLPVHDLVITDMTGSGKTLSYVLPLIANTNNFSTHLQALIVVPTRELSVQVSKVVERLIRGGSKKRKANPVRLLRIAGGSDNVAAVETVSRVNPHILIGTPKILHEVLVVQKAVDTSFLRHAVFDEIDQLLSLPNDKKYCESLMKIRERSSKKRLTGRNTDHDSFADNQTRQLIFVSATITDQVLECAKKLMRDFQMVTPMENPIEFDRRRKNNIRYEGHSTEPEPDFISEPKPEFISEPKPDYISEPKPDSISEPKPESNSEAKTQKDTKKVGPIHVPAHLRHSYVALPMPTLLNLCKTASFEIREIKKQKKGVGALVFVKSRHLVERTVGYLRMNKLSVEGIHQSSTRQERSRAFRLMGQGTLDVLVGTDMLARGLDIQGVTDVVNLGLPRSTNMYLHRSGRTGRLQQRLAKKSQVITIIGDRDQASLLSYCEEAGIKISKRLKPSTRKNPEASDAKEGANVNASSEVTNNGRRTRAGA